VVRRCGPETTGTGGPGQCPARSRARS
jgi:hypothetical protein